MTTTENSMIPQVGDVVSFKYDVEQSGKVESIVNRPGVGKVYMVRAFHGEYVNNTTGTVVDLLIEDIWHVRRANEAVK